MRAIVHREMQVAARRKATYIFRAAAAAIGLALTILFFAIKDEMGATGQALFWIIAITGCFFSVREGFHRAAISLSEERANGTLGLLFLTPLKGFDVVLGKFVSVSMQAFQMALVVMPMLALMLLVGGVSIAEIGRATLCLINLTFFFIVVSLFISSMTASEVSAVFLSVCSIVLVCVLGFISDPLRTLQALSIFNPIQPWLFTTDFRYGLAPSRFWFSLLLSHATGWAILWLAGFFLQRTWPKPEVFPKLAILWTRRKKVSKVRRSTRVLGDSAPLEWLLVRNIYPRAPLLFVLICIGVSIFCWWILRDPEGAVVIGVVALISLAFSLTVHASVTVARARKTGILDLVAVAPISNFGIVKTLVGGLRRAFLAPMVVMTAWLALFFDWKNLLHLIRENHDLLVLTPLYFLASYLLMAWTITYTGIWMALKAKGPARAFLQTAFITIFLPWIMTSFFILLFERASAIPTALYWFVLGNIARQSVRTEFRELILARAQNPPPFPEIH